MPEPTVPKSVRYLVAPAATITLIGAIAGIAAATLGTPQILWSTLGFSIIAAIAAAMGLLAGLGRFTSGYGMATLCIGGTIAVAAGFSMLDLKPNLHANPTLTRLLMPWVAVQVIASAGIVLGGAVAVLSRAKESWRLLSRGLMLLVPAGIIAAAMWATLDAIPENKNGRVLSLAVLVFGGLIVGILVSIGGHFLIRAFEITAEEK